MASKDRLTDLARGATEVNLRFTASLLNLSRDYLKTMRDTLMARSAGTGPQADDGSQPQDATDAPLLVAGRKGETGNAAFTISNTSARNGSVTLTCRGDFGRMRVFTDPDKLDLKSGEVATLRVIAVFDSSIPVGEDRRGDVFVPELERKVAEFVVRRLPDPPAGKKKGTTAKRSKKKA